MCGYVSIIKTQHFTLKTCLTALMRRMNDERDGIYNIIHVTLTLHICYENVCIESTHVSTNVKRFSVRHSNLIQLNNSV